MATTTRKPNHSQGLGQGLAMLTVMGAALAWFWWNPMGGSLWWDESGRTDTLTDLTCLAIAALTAGVIVAGVRWQSRRERRWKRHLNLGLTGLPAAPKSLRIRGVTRVDSTGTPPTFHLTHAPTDHLTELHLKRVARYFTDRVGVEYECDYRPSLKPGVQRPELTVRRVSGGPVIPESADYPIDHLPTVKAGILPFGVTDDQGTLAVWDANKAPHALVTGNTNAGKTATIKAVIVSAWLQGWTIWIVDSKRRATRCFEGWPRIERAGDARGDDSVFEIVDMLRRAHDEMERRLYMGDEELARQERILLVVEEGHDTVHRLNQWWRAHKERGQTGSEHPAISMWTNFIGLCREALMHGLTGIQRPDTKALGAEGGYLRDNMDQRMTLGPQRQMGAKMMWEASIDAAMRVARVAGRCLAGLDGDAVETQVWWLSASALRKLHRRALAALPPPPN